MTGSAERRCDFGQPIDRAADLERERFLAQIAQDVGQVVILAVAGAEVRARGMAPDQLEAENLAGKPHARVEVGAAEANVANVVEHLHRSPFST